MQQQLPPGGASAGLAPPGYAAALQAMPGASSSNAAGATASELAAVAHLNNYVRAKLGKAEAPSYAGCARAVGEKFCLCSRGWCLADAFNPLTRPPTNSTQPRTPTTTTTSVRAGWR
jgi:hypothetical protein